AHRVPRLSDEPLSRSGTAFKQQSLRLSDGLIVLIEYSSRDRALRPHAEDDSGADLVGTNHNCSIEALVPFEELLRKVSCLSHQTVFPRFQAVKLKRAGRASIKVQRFRSLGCRDELDGNIAQGFPSRRIYRPSAHFEFLACALNALHRSRNRGQKQQRNKYPCADHSFVRIKSRVTLACSSALSVTCAA